MSQRDLDDLRAALADLRATSSKVNAKLGEVVVAVSRLREVVRAVRDRVDVAQAIARAERRAAREDLRRGLEP